MSITYRITLIRIIIGNVSKKFNCVKNLIVKLNVLAKKSCKTNVHG